MTTGLAVRPSQFVLTYGVGSILETPGGPRIIPSFDRWGRMLTDNLKTYMIQEDNASAILNGANIFRIPTNVDIGLTDSDILFETIKFPSWALCLKHKKLYELDSHDMTRCRECIASSRPRPGRILSFRHEAIRFVRACSNGHLDDINWNYQVHRGSKCDNQVFEWEGGHSSLEGVKILCKKCMQQITLQDVYDGTSVCSRRKVESNSTDDQCNADMRVVLRSQSSLRMPVIITAITIPPRDSNTYLLLKSMDLKKILADRESSSWTKNDLVQKLEMIRKNAPEEVSNNQLERLREIDEEEIKESIIRIMSKDEGRGISDVEVQESEFRALQRAAQEGAPPPAKKGTTQFEVDKNSVRYAKIQHGTLRITPVNKLRAVMVQVGYTRITPDRTRSKLVKTCLEKNNKEWYPGIELKGEGIFFDFPINFEPRYVSEGDLWMTRFKKEKKNSYIYHPLHIWWHTFSHAIMNVLSVDSGYSSASIRERIYFECDPDGQNARGGLLLYTSQPSGDGSLGGLIWLANNHERLMNLLRIRIKECSNDPLCSSQKIQDDRVNGAACYACMLSSETSCEKSNMFLDRILLKGTI